MFLACVFPACVIVAAYLCAFAVVRLAISWALMETPGAARTVAGHVDVALATTAVGAGRAGASASRALAWVVLAALVGASSSHGRAGRS